jgi:peptide/nickel transport system permease protein
MSAIPSLTEERDVQTSPGSFARLRAIFRRDRAAMLSAVLLLAVLLAAIAAPVVAPRDPTETVLTDFEQPPGRHHWLGTDSAGRDIWSRLVWGSRNSIFVGFVAVALAVTIGVLVGALSGYYRGLFDGLLMRITDAFLSFPSIVLLLMMASILGPRLINVILIIGFLNWTGVARLVRGQFLGLRETEWVMAARSIGATDRQIIFRQMMIHVATPVIISATFGLAGAILTEASLSYLGLGVRPPAPSWGSMLSEAQSIHVLRSVWWAWAAPGGLLFLVVLSISYVGDTFRRALDPRGPSSA